MNNGTHAECQKAAQKHDPAVHLARLVHGDHGHVRAVPPAVRERPAPVRGLERPRLALGLVLERVHARVHLDDRARREVVRAEPERGGRAGEHVPLGEVATKICRDQATEARAAAATFADILGRDNFFLEMQYQGIDDQQVVNKGLQPIARDLSLPLVCTKYCIPDWFHKFF